jgi:hypothetical protein
MPSICNGQLHRTTGSAEVEEKRRWPQQGRDRPGLRHAAISITLDTCSNAISAMQE